MLLLSACSPAPSEHHAEFAVFGSRLEVQLRDVEAGRADAAIAAVGERLQQMHRDLHPWEPGALTALNEALAAGREATVDHELSELIRRAIELERSSLGHFNAAIGGLVRAWGFHTSDYPITTPPPGPEALAPWLPAPSMQSLRWTDGGVASGDARVQLDFSGLAKGLAVREACRILSSHGIEAAMVNAGGDVGVCGSGPRPFRVAIRQPGDGVLEVLEIDRAMAVFTSGNYHRYREFDGRRWAHLVSPFTGQPVEAIVQATVIDPDPIRADAAATALVVAGPGQWRAVARSMGIGRALVVDESGRIAEYVRADADGPRA